MEKLPAKPTPTDACADDCERLRELAAQVERERSERVRLQASCEESRQIVHALNNVLSVITTCAAALADDVAAASPLRENVDEIAHAARSAGSLSRKLGELQRHAARTEGGRQGRA